MSIPSIEEARAAVKAKDYGLAQDLYQQLITYNNQDSAFKDEKLMQLKEQSILELGEMYQQSNELDKLIELLAFFRSTQSLSFAKSKITKIIKNLIELIEKFPGNNNNEKTIKVTQESIEWSISEKRIFLRQSLQLKLATLYYKNMNYNESIKILTTLLKEFKKLDDKLSLVELQLLESKNYFALKNYSKSKSSITAARTSANSIYCSSILQAELDLMSGILNCQEKDFNTGFSYFYESFENYLLNEDNSDNDSKIIRVIKYMLLCKIMLGEIDEVNNTILTKKSILKFVNNKQIESMKLISDAYSQNSLLDFEAILKDYSTELSNDFIIKQHLNELYEKLFEKNLLKLIKPYSCIEIGQLSKLIGLSQLLIENKLSNMILNKVIDGVLDQNNGWLIIYNSDNTTNIDNYSFSLDLIKNMSLIVDSLYEKASLIDINPSTSTNTTTTTSASGTAATSS